MTLSSSLLPPDVLEALPPGLPEEAAFIFWSGWQRATAIRDAYWEERMKLQTVQTVNPMVRVETALAEPVKDDVPDAAKYGGMGDDGTGYRPPAIVAPPLAPGAEAPIGSFTPDTVAKFVDFAVGQSSDAAGARRIAIAKLTEFAPNYRDGNPPSLAARAIMEALDQAGIRGGGEQSLGDADAISDDQVGASAFGAEG